MKCLLLIAVFCVVPCAFQDVWDEYETWYDDFNNLEGDELIGKLDEPEDLPETIQNNDENKEDLDYINDNNYEDYEVEDNRDEVKPNIETDQEANQEQDLDKNDESAIEDFETLQKIINNDDINEDIINKILAVDEKSQMDLNDLLPEDIKNNENVEENIDIGDEDIQQNIDDIKEETQQILENIGSELDEDKVHDDDLKDKSDSGIDIFKDILEKSNKNFEVEKQDVQSIMKETRQILENTNKEFDENNDEKQYVKEESQQIGEILETEKDSNEEPKDIDEKVYSELFPKTNIDSDIQRDIDQTLEALLNKNDETLVKSDEDTVDKVYEDLNSDLDKLFQTWKKLSVDNDVNEPNTNVENIDSAENKNKQVKLEEPNADDDFGRDKVEIGDEVKEENNFDYEGEARILATRNDYYESILDKDLSNLFQEFEDNNEDEAKDGDSDDTVPILYNNDALDADLDENIQQDAELKSDNLNENEKSDANAVEAELKLSDDIVHNEAIATTIIDDQDDSEIIHEDEAKATTITYDQDDSEIVQEEKLQDDEVKSEKLTKNVDDLTSGELDELSIQFKVLYNSEMKMDGDETPIHITLTADEPVVITSPNYDSAYPTDISTIDWILEGFGTGIEVNVTDLEINSAMGHYLMLKPGQTDASGDQGIVFAHRLNHERRFRFRDVNRMLVRFNPVGGMSFARGFKLSAKIIEPPTSDNGSGEDIEPEELLPEPQETATLLLSGANSTSFEDLREEFRRLLADMAVMYINSNDIMNDPDMDVNITAVTQITNTYVCNMKWPGFDSCVSVTFAVPLYDNRLNERELLDMWLSFVDRDPFAARLARMGISVYTPPRDNFILTMWVVIGVVVLISTTMLAVVLWRYSCVENYTRMVDYNDTDSVIEKKRGLDMYPTPHQTLPPLYSENDYKWADGTFDDSTRVDLGGFTNNTFTRDELTEESEDETVKRDRNSFTPRDISAV